jgi:hypothetical protein
MPSDHSSQAVVWNIPAVPGPLNTLTTRNFWVSRGVSCTTVCRLNDGRLRVLSSRKRPPSKPTDQGSTIVSRRAAFVNTPRPYTSRHALVVKSSFSLQSPTGRRKTRTSAIWTFLIFHEIAFKLPNEATDHHQTPVHRHLVVIVYSTFDGYNTPPCGCHNRQFCTRAQGYGCNKRIRRAHRLWSSKAP